MVICCKFKKNLFNLWLYTHLFYDLKMYIAACQGQKTPGDKILMSTETSWHFGHLLQVSKKSFWRLILYNFFFMILYMYIGLGRGWQPLGNKIFMSVGTSCHFCHLCKFQKNLFEVWFYTICFMILYMYIAPGQGQTAPRGQSFDINRNVLSLHSFVASFKKIFLKSDFIQFFHDLIHVCIPLAEADNPRGQNFDVNRKTLSLSHLLQVSKKSLWSLILYIFFHDLIHVYSQGQGAYSPKGTKFWCQQKLLVSSVIHC